MLKIEVTCSKVKSYRGQHICREPGFRTKINTLRDVSSALQILLENITSCKQSSCSTKATKLYANRISANLFLSVKTRRKSLLYKGLFLQTVSVKRDRNTAFCMHGSIRNSEKPENIASRRKSFGKIPSIVLQINGNTPKRGVESWIAKHWRKNSRR